MLIDQKKFYAAAQHLCSAVHLTTLLRANVAENVMRAIARYFRELGHKHRYVQALRTVYEIVQAEDVDLTSPRPSPTSNPPERTRPSYNTVLCGGG